MVLSVLIAVAAMFNPTARAISLEVNVGDRGVYEGPEFWDYGWHYVWVPGHMEHHHWVRGYYERRGDWSHRFLKTHHNWHHHDDDDDHHGHH